MIIRKLGFPLQTKRSLSSLILTPAELRVLIELSHSQAKWPESPRSIEFIQTSAWGELSLPIRTLFSVGHPRPFKYWTKPGYSWCNPHTKLLTPPYSWCNEIWINQFWKQTQVSFTPSASSDILCNSNTVAASDRQWSSVVLYSTEAPLIRVNLTSAATLHNATWNIVWLRCHFSIVQSHW